MTRTPIRNFSGIGERGGAYGLVVRRRAVDGSGLAGGLFGVGDALGEAGHLPLQPLDQLPLRRDGRVEVLNCLVLMGSAHFKLVEAGGGVGCV